MKKIPTIFIRNPDDRKHLLDEWNPECLWVHDGEGVATRKYDGTCCAIWDGNLYKRREVSKDKAKPEGFQRIGFDEITGKSVGWVPCSRLDPGDKWHFEALDDSNPLSDGTYELCGPKIQGNPERLTSHMFYKHSDAQVYNTAPRTHSGLSDWLLSQDNEGIVFHHPDGRMAKIKKRDFE